MVVQNKSHQETAELGLGRTFEMLTGPGYKEHEIDRDLKNSWIYYLTHDTT